MSRLEAPLPYRRFDSNPGWSLPRSVSRLSGSGIPSSRFLFQRMIARFPMATVTEPAAAEGFEVPSIVIDGATWADYEAILLINGDRRIFVNYNHGVME